MDMFAVQYKGRHGSTVKSDNPTLDALKQAAYLRMCGYVPEIIWQADKSVTVKAAGLDSITYEPDAEG